MIRGVMPALVAGIPFSRAGQDQDVDGRDKPGHDDHMGRAGGDQCIAVPVR
jgi:hypothetical protein